MIDTADKAISSQIWVDADACPKVIRELVSRAAIKRELFTTFVSNKGLSLRNSRFLRTLQVPQGFDAADRAIIERVTAGDLVITSDIPLAAEVLKQGTYVVSFRAERYTSENIGSRLQMRDFFETMRASMPISGGLTPLTEVDVKAFADLLDRTLTAYF